MRDNSDPPIHWEERPLGEIFDVLDSRRIPVNARERATRQGDIPYYGATGQVGWIDDHIFDEELVLLGEDGAPFLDGSKPKAYVIHGKAWVNNHAHVLRPLGGSPASFWKYQLDQVQYRKFVSGTTRLKLPQSPMKSIPLYVPPVGEQRRLAAALDSLFTRLDDARSNLGRVRRNLERYRAAVLRAAVEGRLVPTEADLARTEGRDWQHASDLLKRIIDERRRRAGAVRHNGKHLAPVAPHTAGLPVLPEGWCWATVDQLAYDVRYGTSTKARNDLQGGVPILRMGNIVDGRIEFTSLKYLPVDHREFPDLLLQPGDILFNRTNSAELVGKTAVFGNYHLPCSFASYLIRLRLCDGAHPAFVSYFVNSPAGRAWIASVVSQQVGQANVNGTKLKACVVPLPPMAEQERIVRHVDRLLSLAFSIELCANANCERSAHLRQEILKWGFAGKLADKDSSDEPASVLLERIHTERSKVASSPQAPRRRARLRKAVKK